MTLEKIISGGQTGVDQIGLRVGKYLGIPTGGTAPKNYKTEKGLEYKLQEYGLTQSYSDDYAVRTENNVEDSDGTVLFGDMTSAGSRQTIMLCLRHKKPYLCNPDKDMLVNFIDMIPVKTLNVAGNRGSKLTPEQEGDYATILVEAINDLLHELPF